MKKKFGLLAILFALLCVVGLSLLPADAQAAEELASGTCGDNVTWVLTDDGVLTISGTGAMTDFETASEIPWYSKREEIITIIVEDGVTSIGDWAFCGCSGLASVTIGEAVQTIGDYAFSDCSGITSMIIPDTVIRIGLGAFSGCSSLETLTIPFVGRSPTYGPYEYPLGYIFGYSRYTGGVETLQRYCRYDPTYTASDTFYIPATLKSVTVTGGKIPYGAFYNCSGLTHIDIPENVTSIGRYAFYNCSGLTSINIPEGVTTLPDRVFARCKGLTAIHIPESVTSIGMYAFSNCSSLTSINIPEGVTTISSYAFSNCSGITSMIIPDAVTHIGFAAFSGCSNLKNLTIPFVGQSRKTATDTYQDTFGYIFGESSYTGGVATKQYFYGSSITSTTHSTYYIPASLKSVTVTGGEILYGAFYNCGNLVAITLPDSLTSIGDDAFNNCGSLWHVLYTGTEEAWNAISIGSNNDALTSATRHYNCTGNEVIDTENNICPICNQKCGDVNCDGWTDVEDAMMILQYEVGLLDDSDLYLTVGDVSGDGWVDVEDAMLILQYEVGLVEQFPAEEISATATALDFRPATLAIPQILIP